MFGCWSHKTVRKYLIFSNPANIYLFKVNNKNTSKEVWNMFKVYNKNRTTSSTSFWWFYCKLWTYFTPFSSVFIVEFDQVHVTWEDFRQCWAIFKIKFFKIKRWWFLDVIGKNMLQKSQFYDNVQCVS